MSDIDMTPRLRANDEDLEVTFGPQWREIVALVRRAATLTEDEAERLRAAEDAAWAAAWVAARDAAWDAARDAAEDAARATAWTAVRAAVGSTAGDAAGFAARALVTRDLIGQHGFEQHHYDMLVAPWVSVIGKVHPDD